MTRGFGTHQNTHLAQHFHTILPIAKVKKKRAKKAQWRNSIRMHDKCCITDAHQVYKEL